MRHGKTVQLVACSVRSVQLEESEHSVSQQDSADHGEAEVFMAIAPPQGACENLVCALNVLTTTVSSVKSGLKDSL